MAQLPCTGLSWPLTKLPFGSCAIYFHHSVSVRHVGRMHLAKLLITKCRIMLQTKILQHTDVVLALGES